MILLMSIMFITGPGRFPAGAVRAEEIQQSLPTVRIHIEGGQDEINMMNSSSDHSYECSGTMDIEVPDGFKYFDSNAEPASLHDLKIETIRVKVGKKSINKRFMKRYRKIFTRKNAGKKAAVK